ncbi:uncharacterized protein LOC119603982 isoform X1 [Lucilia sericata]|uniref:uncharacterized protein LOC119603982 isoform X1 n=1 Tax=Lucilia sericata TaxID=13632 RepID=UPI0018A811FC|nr:uncharacterized protein LOC119603982 isoform X1 [Lucilia sericata]
MSGLGRNVANNMLFTCIKLLLFIASFNNSSALATVEPLSTPDNLPTSADIMASEARGSIDRIDTISNLLPHPANFLLDNIVSTAGSTAGIVTSVNLTRQHDGDIFWTNGVNSCNADTCVGLSSGTASWLAKGINKMGSLVDATGGSKSQLELLVRQTQHKLKDKSSSSAATAASTAANANGESCQCRCLPYLNTYREDLGICVDDIHECTLSPFVSGSSSEKIPFVFLPLRGQIIYPSREISFADIRTPVCAVTGAQYLTPNGWSELRNPIDTDYPFRMFRDEGRTFLQWLGEADLRHKMQGRLIVVHLVCRDMTLSLNATASNDHLMPPKNVFSPCVAFRVNGSPVKYANNVSEVLFQAEATTTLASTSDGMSTKEYIVIGVCSLLLGLIYVSSVFLYLHMKKRKSRDQSRSRNSLDDLNNEINYPKNDQVTFGAPFTRSGSLYSAGSLTTSNEPRSRASLSSMKEEMGIVKNNPLLQHFPQLNDHHSGFTSDISNSNSECEMDGGGGNYHDKVKQMQTNALVHPQMGMMMNNGSPKGSHHSSNNGAQSQGSKEDDGLDSNANSQENECLPPENVAIIEEMMTEEKLESLRAMVNGNIRKKLYFNPAYFEPHLLAQPPPAALEFLQKIREVIAIAKYKMATKRYQPSLTLIPEEGTPRSNTPSVYGSQLHTPSECQGCVTNRCSGHVKNCGDKRNSIEKWLETVQSTEDNRSTEQGSRDANANDKERQSPSSSGSSKTPEGLKSPNMTPAGKRITPPKQKPPPPPIHKPGMASNQLRNQIINHNLIEEESQYNTPTDNRNSSSIYQKSRNSLNIPVMQHKLDAYSALTASAHMYGFAETGGEIYNNPKFMLHDSPAASQRSRSSSQRSKNSRKRLDVLDQYAAASTPTSLSSTERQHYNMLRSMEQMNDHLDSNTLERIHQEYTATLRSNGSFNLDIPTPDYDSTMEKKIKDIYNNTQSSGPSVPTPDYSSLSRKSLKQYQPDSPIYRRKSPQYLIVDYETDSLERLEATKRKSSQSSSSPSSDVSSQLSPSLSTALPLEEELEISHTVYQGDGFNTKSLGSQKKNLIRTLESSALKKDMAARIKYDTPFRGSMTIEVEHEPPSDLERSTDSDQYEPDTLDRKPKKQSFCDVNAWSNVEMKRANDNQSTPPQSLPDMSKRPVKVESQNSFRLKPNDTPSSTACRRQISRDSAYESQVELRRPCGNEEFEEDTNSKVSNLRDIYQSLLVRQNSDCSCKCGGQATSMFLQEQIEDLSDKGRILTLEAKHSRRQRPSQPPTPPAMVEISNESSNKCTIKITTPKASRVNVQADKRPTEYVEPRVHQKPVKEDNNTTSTKYLQSPRQLRSLSATPPSRIKRSLSQSPQTPPPPPPPTSASTTLNSRTSRASSNTQHQYRAHSHTEEETMSNHSESTEVTGISGTMTNSEFGGTMDKKTPPNKLHKTDKTLEKPKHENINSAKDSTKADKTEAQQTAKKLREDDFGAIFNTHINGLRNDYSLNKYLNRRKSQDRSEDPAQEGLNATAQQLELQIENNNNLKHSAEIDPNKIDVVSLSSRSNRSSSRLSDRTKEMYRNAGVPVGIAYPQRNNANNNNNSNSNNNNNSSSNSNPATPNPPANNVQTVYRCEIEPVQLTHGMQIAMGLKDRPKKAKDIKNAWKKFVSMAASKFSPTQSPAPPFDKKAGSILEVLERDEGISSLIEDHPQVSTPKSSYSAPASQNYYEQRFGPRLQEMDSGYMSADSGEAHKRTFYDRYNFKMMSERDHIIRVSTIEDNSDGDSTLTDRHKGQEASARRGSILDTNRFEDFEHINEQQQQLQKQQVPLAENTIEVIEDESDNDSDKTLTRSNTQRRSPTQSSSSTTFTSDEDEEEPITTSYGSSETDGETNVDDMWESGAESVETHSVLYKNIRKSLER